MSVDSVRRTSKKMIYSWALYDWANSAFATTIMAAVLPTFYSDVAAKNLPRVTASSYWGYTNTIVMLLIALSAPVLGAMADHSGAKKRYLGSFASLGILATAAMYFISTGDWLLASILYILGRAGFAGANIFYDSLLPHIAGEDNIDRVSALGYAIGYLGGGLLLAVNLAWIMMPGKFGFPNAEIATRISFVSVAVWWAIFSVPLFKNVPEPPAARIAGESAHPIKAGFQRIGKTFSEIRQYRQLFRFLLAFWLYNDGIGTIIVMAVIYGKEIGIGTTDLIGTILMIQFVGVPFSLLFGRIPGWIGSTKRAILLALSVYMMIAIGGYFMQTALHFWLLGFAVAMVQGGSQALSRSLYGAMTPKSKSAEMFGFYDVSSKFAGILGPAMFGVVGQLTGSSRLSIVSLVIFFIIGGALLLTVNEKEGIKVAKEIDQELHYSHA